MKRISRLVLLTSLAVVTLCLSPVLAEDYTSTDVPKAITDLNTTTSVIDVASAGTVADVNVTLDITHTFNADLHVMLISPSGTTVELFTDVGVYEENFTNTTLDDEAAISITEGTEPYTGTFRPETPLSVLDGEALAGIWTLTIYDEWWGDIGSLNSWSLSIITEGGGPAPNVSLNAPSPDTLWPPNEKPSAVTIRGSVEDAGGGIGDVWLSVNDEYDQYDVAAIPVTLAADGSFSTDVDLVAGRSDDDADGRCYEVTLHATNSGGDEATPVSVVVTVPHDLRL